MKDLKVNEDAIGNFLDIVRKQGIDYVILIKTMEKDMMMSVSEYIVKHNPDLAGEENVQLVGNLAGPITIELKKEGVEFLIRGSEYNKSVRLSTSEDTLDKVLGAEGIRAKVDARLAGYWKAEHKAKKE